MIMMTASIFMTVAIAMERYVAVHYPIDYNQVNEFLLHIKVEYVEFYLKFKDFPIVLLFP